MKKCISMLGETILRAVSLYLAIFIFGSIYTMVLYKDTSLVMFTILAFVLSFTTHYVAERLPLFKEERSATFLRIVNAIQLLCGLAVGWHLYQLYWKYPIIYTGHEMEITTVFEMKRNAYMLVRAIPSYLHAQLAYVSGTSDATFDIDQYKVFELLNQSIYALMLIYGLCKTFFRANGVSSIRRGFHETNRTKEK